VNDWQNDNRPCVAVLGEAGKQFRRSAVTCTYQHCEPRSKRHVAEHSVGPDRHDE
jgi:hypothetical protein